MEIQDIVHLTAEQLRGEGYFADVPVIEEDVGDVPARLAADMGKRRLAVIVGWDGFTSRGDSSTVIFGEATVVVSVFEQPVVNRRTEGAKTLLMTAREVASALHLFTVPGTSPLVFRKITPVQALTGGDRGVISCDVQFVIETDL